MNTQLDPIILLSALTRTHELVQRGWCQGDYAQLADGSFALTNDPAVCKWSVIGATYVALFDLNRTDLLPRVSGYLHNFLPPGINYPEDYNDLPTTTQADILALLNRAIEGMKK